MAYCYPRAKVWWIGYRDDNREDPEVREPTKIRIGRTKTEQRNSEFEALAVARTKEEKAWRVFHKLAEPDVEPVLFESLSETYLAVRASKKKSAETIGCRIRGHIIPHFRGRMAHLITPEDIEIFLGHRAQGVACATCAEKGCAGSDRRAERKTCPCQWKCHKRQAPETLNKLRNHLSAIFRYGIDTKRCLKGPNPVRMVERAQVPKREPRVVPDEALASFLDVADDDVRGVFAVLLYTGVRKKEALRLRVPDVDLGRGLIKVTDFKTGNWRVVPIPKGLVPYLKLELGRARSEWLFPDENGKPRSEDWALHERMRTTLVRAGVIEGWEHICRNRGSQGFGERNSRAKLTSEQVAEIRASSAMGTELAERFGVSPNLIHKVRRGLVWRAPEQTKACGHRERHADRTPRLCPKCARRMAVRAVRPNLTTKDLRSTFATLAAEETSDKDLVQKLLGHQDGRTTDRYIKMRDKRLLARGRALNIVAATHKSLTEEGDSAPVAPEAEAETA